VNTLLETLEESTLTYVPAPVVATTRNAMAWYEGASLRTMFFQPSSDSAVKAFDAKVVPQPALLFLAKGRGLRVYALASDDRPTLDTALYYAPYWNMIGDGHEVCIGSMVLPKRVDPEATTRFSDAFFQSNFTHHQGVKRYAFGGTYAELLAAACAKGTFDSSWLVPAKKTLRQVISGR
jgi:PRTRC genetic system protein B